MIIKTSEKIINHLKEKGDVSVKDLVDFLGINRSAVYGHIDKLFKQDKIKKIGKPPRVFYSLKKITEKNDNVEVDSGIKSYIDENFLFITPSGEKLKGLKGFLYWCEKTRQKPIKTSVEYVSTLKKFNKYKIDGLISGLDKFKNTFKNEVYLNKIYYLDFYSIERFGKTRLGQLLLYGKQSGNIKLIKEIVSEIKPKIDRIIKKESIDGVCFIPWTVRRDVQFMRELEKMLKLNIKSIDIEKAKTEITVPQKTLNKLEDRIENAKNTMIVTDKSTYKKILLLDDAVGSGATLNEVAKQIKQKKIAKKVIGVAITGSFKGFDIISEV